MKLIPSKVKHVSKPFDMFLEVGQYGDFNVTRSSYPVVSRPDGTKYVQNEDGEIKDMVLAEDGTVSFTEWKKPTNP